MRFNTVVIIVCILVSLYALIGLIDHGIAMINKEVQKRNENSCKKMAIPTSDDYYGEKVTISQDGSLIVVEGKDGQSYVYSLENGEWVERKFAKYDDLAAGSKPNVKMTGEGDILECGELKYVWDDDLESWINITPIMDGDKSDKEE